jgi:hypothetical protein
MFNGAKQLSVARLPDGNCIASWPRRDKLSFAVAEVREFAEHFFSFANGSAGENLKQTPDCAQLVNFHTA